MTQKAPITGVESAIQYLAVLFTFLLFLYLCSLVGPIISHLSDSLYHARIKDVKNKLKVEKKKKREYSPITVIQSYEKKNKDTKREHCLDTLFQEGKHRILILLSQ